MSLRAWLWCLLICPTPALACTIRTVSVETAIAEADAILRGTVIKSDAGKQSLGLNRTYTVRVSHVFKGDVPAEVEFVVGHCGFGPLRVGTEWLLVAHHTPYGWRALPGQHSEQVGIPRRAAPAVALFGGRPGPLKRLRDVVGPGRPLIPGLKLINARRMDGQLLNVASDGRGRALAVLPDGVFSVDLASGKRTQRYVPGDDESVVVHDRSVFVSSNAHPVRIQTRARGRLRPATRPGIARGGASAGGSWMIIADSNAPRAHLFETGDARQRATAVTSIDLKAPLLEALHARTVDGRTVRVYGHGGGETAETNEIWFADVDRKQGTLRGAPRLVARGDLLSDVVTAGDVDLILGERGLYWVDSQRATRVKDGIEGRGSGARTAEGLVLVSQAGVLRWFDPKTRAEVATVGLHEDLVISWQSGARIGGVWPGPDNTTWLVEFAGKRPKVKSPSTGPR